MLRRNGSPMNFRARSPRALASAERTRVPVTVRIHAVILGPSSGGRRPTTQSPNQMIGEVIINGVARSLSSRAAIGVSQLVRGFANWVVREV